MAENRLDRELEDRESDTRTQSWRRPELLPEPKQIDGYAYRWIRVATQGQHDAANVSSKIREGWVPCKAEDHPEITIVHQESEAFADNIVIGGLMLCKAPLEMVKERNEFYEQRAQAQVESVDNNFLRENDSRMPLFSDKKSTVSFGGGK